MQCNSSVSGSFTLETLLKPNYVHPTPKESTCIHCVYTCFLTNTQNASLVEP